MDNQSLRELLTDKSDRQYWLKPIGWPANHPNWHAPDDRRWGANEIEVHFHRRPRSVRDGDVVIGYRIRVLRVTYVATRLPEEAWTTPVENRLQEAVTRWPHLFKARNFTPNYGSIWPQFDIDPFQLAEEYTLDHPDDPVRLGGIQFGSDRVRIPPRFAKCLMRQIERLPE